MIWYDWEIDERMHHTPAICNINPQSMGYQMLTNRNARSELGKASWMVDALWYYKVSHRGVHFRPNDCSRPMYGDDCTSFQGQISIRFYIGISFKYKMSHVKGRYIRIIITASEVVLACNIDLLRDASTGKRCRAYFVNRKSFCMLVRVTPSTGAKS